MCHSQTDIDALLPVQRHLFRSCLLFPPKQKVLTIYSWHRCTASHFLLAGLFVCLFSNPSLSESRRPPHTHCATKTLIGSHVWSTPPGSMATPARWPTPSHAPSDWSPTPPWPPKAPSPSSPIGWVLHGVHIVRILPGAFAPVALPRSLYWHVQQ